MTHTIYLCVVSLMLYGGVTFARVIWFWEKVATDYRGWIYKTIGEGARLATVILVPVCVTIGMPEKYRNLCVYGLGISYFFWVSSSNLAEYKTARDKKTEQETIVDMTAAKDVAVGQLYLKESLLSSIKEMIINKKHKILSQAKTIPELSKSKFNSKKPLHEALDAKHQCKQIVTHMALFFKDQLPDGESKHRQNFRVAFYVSEDGTLKPFASFDLRNQAHDFLRAFKDHESHFRLDCIDRPSCAVRSIRDGRAMIISNCEENFDGVRNHYLHARQQAYLKSMVAYPIANFGSSIDESFRACVMIDTDLTGHFREADRLTIESTLEQFAVRLDLEYSVYRLLSAKHANSQEVSNGRS